MIRSILVPLAEGPATDAAREHAFWLARKQGSRITAIAVIDIKAFEIPVLGTPDGFMPSVVTPPISESRSLVDELSSAARDRLERFAAECLARSIPCSTDSRTGIPAEIVSQEAVAHDIVVLSHHGYTQLPGSSNRADPFVSQVIRGSVRPVLVAGEGLREERAMRRILIAFDGSSNAARALTVAAELGSRPDVECTLLCVAASDETGRECLLPAETYLCNHGVSSRQQVVIGSKASEVICEIVEESKPDVLIMGAFGHSPVREVLFGSTTENVLNHCTASVLLQS